jgi:hypothetical protein
MLMAGCLAINEQEFQAGGCCFWINAAFRHYPID